MTPQQKIDKVLPYVGKKVFAILMDNNGAIHTQEVTLKSALVRGEKLALVEFNEYDNYPISADLVGIRNESNQYVSICIETTQ